MWFQTLDEQNQRPQCNVKSTLTDQKLQYAYCLLQRRLSSRLTQVYIPLQNRKESMQIFAILWIIISPFLSPSFTDLRKKGKKYSGTFYQILSPTKRSVIQK